MLQIIAFGISFILVALGSIVCQLVIANTPVEKRTWATGFGIQSIIVILGIIIFLMAFLQGAGMKLG